MKKRKTKTIRQKVFDAIDKLPNRFSSLDVMRRAGINIDTNQKRTVYKILGERMIVGDIKKVNIILDDQRESLYEKVE